MQKEFVPYELAVKLKALGFDEPCLSCYNKLGMIASHGQYVFDYKNYNSSVSMVSRPTFSQAFRWFRQKNFYVSINTYHSVNLDKPFGLSIDYLHESGKWGYVDFRGDIDFETYEEAELACLEKLIEIVETQPNF